MHPEDHELAIEASPDRVLAAVSAMADEWGGEWRGEGHGGRLYLPVVAGLRRGLLEAQVEARSSSRDGTLLTLRGDVEHWRVHRSAAGILVMGALGALPVILWPLGPRFLALAPVGLVFMFLAWFMVVSRLRTAGGAEFLEAVRLSLSDGGEG